MIYLAQDYKTSEWKGKKVVVVAVPGAFTVRPKSSRPFSILTE